MIRYTGTQEKIYFPFNGNILLMNDPEWQDILYFESDKDYIKIWLVDETRPVMTLMSMKSLEEVLPDSIFMRVHRPYIISLDKIQEEMILTGYT